MAELTGDEQVFNSVYTAAEREAAIANARTSAAMRTALGVTSDEMAGLAAANGASAENPVATMDDLPVVPEIPSQVNMPTSDQKAALAGTSGTPSSSNPYATKATTDLALLPDDTRLAPTSIFFVDGTRTDTYTANGTTARPYKDYAGVLAKWTRPITVIGTKASYTAGSNPTLPNYPITVYASEATLTCTGTFTTQSDFKAYDLNTVGNVVAAGSTHVRYNGSITGTLTVNSGCNCCLRNVTVTGATAVYAGGTLCYDESCKFLGGITESGSGGAILPLADQNAWYNLCADSGCGLGSGFSALTTQATPTVTISASTAISFTAATATMAHSGSGFGSVLAGDFFVVTGSTGNDITGSVTTASAASLVCAFRTGDPVFADESSGASITVKFYRYTASTWFANSSYMGAGKLVGWALYDNSTYGGTRGVLNAFTVALLTALGRALRYGKEFGIVEFPITGAGYLFLNGAKSLHGTNSTVSAGMWVYHTSGGTVTLGSGYAKVNQFYAVNGGPWTRLSGNATYSIPANTWTHIMLTEKSAPAYNTVFPCMVTSASGGTLSIAQYAVTQGRPPSGTWINPVKTYTTAQ